MEDPAERASLEDPPPPARAPWSEPGATDLTWGVGAVATRLGVAASTLRTWERRYGVGPSHRTQGGHRRYTQRDIDRVELVRRLVARAVPAKEAARVARHLDRDELRVALDAHHPSGQGGTLSEADLVDALVAAAVTGDVERLRDLVEALADRDDLAGTWCSILSPALVRMAAERSNRRLDAATERSAIDVVVDVLRAVRARCGASPSPQVLIASAVEDGECLPMLALGAALVRRDVSVRTTGPETDARALADLARKLDPRVVVVWGHPLGVDAGVLRRHQDGPSPHLLRAASAWPHEVGLRVGADDRLLTTDVAATVQHVLDHLP